MSVLGGLVKRVDAWANVLTGLGTTRDKVTWTLPTQQRRLPDELAASIFRGDDVARKILTKLPSEMLRNGFSIKVQTTSQRSGPDEELPEMDRADAHQTITDLETSSALTMRHQELGTAAACLKGLVWGRTFGAGVLVLGVEDGGRPEDPLREDAIRSFRYIHVFDRRSVTVDRFYDDPLAPGFGKPEVFRLQPVTASRRGSSTVLVHESRCVVFPGVLTEDLVRAENGGWDDSLLQSLWTTLQREATNWATIGHLLSDASQGVYKVKGLLDIIARGEKAAMQTRAELIEICRSAARAIVVDAEHEG
ncbi:DUF1073 domain-containing protein, partial [Myxococcota bacterium]|nr:DUF1073 domain-containing protein [Myxococcota bacterium]